MSVRSVYKLWRLRDGRQRHAWTPRAAQWQFSTTMRFRARLRRAERRCALCSSQTATRHVFVRKTMYLFWTESVPVVSTVLCIDRYLICTVADVPRPPVMVGRVCTQPFPSQQVCTSGYGFISPDGLDGYGEATSKITKAIFDFFLIHSTLITSRSVPGRPARGGHRR